MTRKLIIVTAATALFVAWMGSAAQAATEKRACFKAPNGVHHIVAENNFRVNANRTWCRGWEQHTVIDLNDGELEDGDRVAFRTAHGRYWSAQSNGLLLADRVNRYGWETFTLVKVSDGDSVVRDGDRFALRTYHNRYVVAEHSGGSVVNANRGAIGPWETFTYIDLDPVEPPPPPADATLRVTHPGDAVGAIRGTGDIWSTCRPECVRRLPVGTEVILEAHTVGNNSIEFDRWEGACAGQGPTCRFTLEADANVALRMRVKPDFVDLVVRKSGATVEDVQVSPIGSVWIETRRRYATGTTITLTAEDDTLHAARFVGWSGACAGQGRSCTLTLNANTTAVANYVQDPVYRLHVTHPGTAVGAIRGTDGIWSTCRPGCERFLAPGTEVVLEANTVGDNTIEFDRWEGACEGQGARCTFTLDGDRSATLYMRDR